MVCFFVLKNESSLIIHVDYDAAEPAANSVSARNLLRLSVLCEKKEWNNMARDMLCLFSDQLNQAPASMPELIVASILFKHQQEITISGDENDPEVLLTYRKLIKQHRPQTIVRIIPGEPGGEKNFSMHSCQYEECRDFSASDD